MAEVAARVGRVGLTVAVVDDHSMITSGLAALLAQSGVAVEEFASVEGLGDGATFDVVLLDLHLGPAAELQGCAAVQALSGVGARVVVISGGAEQVDICDSIGLGARSFTPKDRVDLLAEVVEAVAAGHYVLTGALAGALLADVSRRPIPAELAGHELGADDVSFLEDAFYLDGAAAASLSRGWTADQTEQALGRLWQTAAIRTAAYALSLTAREIDIVTLAPSFGSRDELIAHLRIAPATFQKHLTNIKSKYIEAYPAAANLSPYEILHVLGRRAL